MVGSILKLMLTRGTSIKRWSNFPRVEYISHIDNVGFTIHIALFLAFLEEQECGSHIDKTFLIKKMIFDSFKGLILADINAGTKQYIQKFDKKIFAKVQEKGLEKIFSLDAPSYIKKDLQDTLKDNSNRIENKLISAAKKYAGFLEAKTNHSAYENIYDLPLKELKKSLKEQKETLKSLDILLSHKGYKKYLTQIRRLSHSMRWSGESKLLPISVMAHLVEVTFISYIIASIENHEKKDSVDTLEMLLRSIYHDIPEAITGDIINPTKKSVPGFAEVLEKVEKAMLDDYLFCHAPKNFKTEIERYIFQPFDEKEGKLVKYSDIFAALFEAKIEGLYGNTREFEDICKNLEKILSPLPLKSVQYLLHQGISSFVEKNGIN